MSGRLTNRRGPVLLWYFHILAIVSNETARNEPGILVTISAVGFLNGPDPCAGSQSSMLFCTGGMVLTFGMVTLAMMFSGGTMCLGCVIMMLGSLVMFVFCHVKPLWLLASQSPPNR